MQVIADPQAPSNFFFIGLRAPIGGLGPSADRVGVVVLKQRIRADGSIDNRPQILLTDEFLNPPPDPPPLRLEADLAPIKPLLDAVVAATVANDQTLFGDVQVNRGGVLSPLVPLNFGWARRVEGPRLDHAGDDLINFVPTGNNLPQDFNNAFFNGREMAGVGLLGTGDVVTFMPSSPPPPPPPPTLIVRIPPAPSIRISRDGAPVSPPVSVVPVVDTVVFDPTATEFLITWRGSFLWEDRLEDATLEIS